MPAPSLAATSYAAAQDLLTSSLRASSGTASSASSSDFAALVRDQVAAAQDADRQMTQAATGQTDLLSVVTAVSETETTLETLVAVRDKVIAAYEDVMRMTI